MAEGKTWDRSGISRPPGEVGRIWPCQCSGPKLGQERGIWAEDLTGPWGNTTCSSIFLLPAPRGRVGQARGPPLPVFPELHSTQPLLDSG